MERLQVGVSSNVGFCTANLSHPVNQSGKCSKGIIQIKREADGVVFTPSQQAEEILLTARTIKQTERRQSETIQAGKKLREQLRFDEYLVKCSTDPTYTFRQHLQRIGGAIEE